MAGALLQHSGFANKQSKYYYSQTPGAGWEWRGLLSRSRKQFVLVGNCCQPKQTYREPAGLARLCPLRRKEEEEEEEEEENE